MNEDFSFMRFLKVVKTLYETSTFTQLGKTVGSALTTTPGVMVHGKDSAKNREDDAEIDAGSNKYKPAAESLEPFQESILDAIAEACKPARKATKKCVDEDSIKDAACGASSKHDDPSRHQSLFEQMMNCTLLGQLPDDEYFSDEEDTYRTRTYDDDVQQEESFESLTEDDERYRRRHRSSRRRRR